MLTYDSPSIVVVIAASTADAKELANNRVYSRENGELPLLLLLILFFSCKVVKDEKEWKNTNVS